jgi:hypothetical protein
MATMTSTRIQPCVALVAFRQMFFVVKVSLALIVVLTLPVRAEKAASADAFVDSVGVNVHLHNLDTAYSNFPKIKQSLLDLGIRHIRDGMIDTSWQDFYDRHNELGRSGVMSIFTTSPAYSDQLLLDYPQRMKDSFEAYESPNEYDQSRDPDWSGTLSKFIARLNGTVKGSSNTSRFPVIGPSLTSQNSFVKMRGACSFDSANLHNYLGGRNPGTPGWGANGYGSISWNLSLVATACPGKPVMTTETGYQTDQTLTQGIPDDVAGRYVLRTFLEQWQHGIQRTYLYELIDLPPGHGPGDSSFGLLRADFSPKPAYTALKNLMHLLSDPGPSFAGEEHSFTLSGDLADVHHALFEKRDGTFYLALWVEAPSFDVNSQKPVAVPVHNIVVQSDAADDFTSQSFDKSGNLQTAALGGGATHAIAVSDSVTILTIDSRPPAPVLNRPVVQ